MKRLLGWTFVCMLLCFCGVLAEDLPESLTLAPGESVTLSLPFAGYWESDSPEVAFADGNTVTAGEPGTARLALIAWDEEQELFLDVTVGEADADTPPALIQNYLDIALQEWQDGQGQVFSTKKPHKYTIWYCGNQSKCYFGWCGGFIGYCMKQAGVPMDEPYDSVPHPDGDPYSVYAAGVGKIYTGFEKMHRLSRIPIKGSLVIYGERDHYAYTHIGTVTDVIDHGDGTYQIFTVEGNVSSRIKRFSFMYDSNYTTEKEHQRDMTLVPEEQRTQPELYEYEKQYKNKNWYINVFCHTWGVGDTTYMEWDKKK